ncbi:MAG TPA: hypothetical protein VH143_06000 [Kofleriaceae bacterium]|jgi:hypothetical protein|nr:hypothetical protein [Kofleriaceae bacterium]
MFARIRTTPLFVTACIAAVALRLVDFVIDSGASWLSFETAPLAAGAMWSGIQLATCAGLFELASRLTGGGHKAMRVVAWISAAQLVSSIVSMTLRTLWVASAAHGTTGLSVYSFAMFALQCAAPIAWGIAAWHGAARAGDARAIRRGHVLAIALPLILALAAVAYSLLPMLLASTDGVVAFERHLIMVQSCIGIATTCCVLALAVLVRPALEPVPSARLAAVGLRAIAGSLWLRIAATVIVALAMLQFVSTFGDTSSGPYQIAMLVQSSAELVLFGVLSLGAFAVARAALDGTPRRVFVLAGFGAGWCAGVMLFKIPYAYAFTLGKASSNELQMLDSLSIGEPIVAVATIAVVVFALRQLHALAGVAETVSLRGLAFVVAMLISIAVANIGIERYGAIGVLAFGGVMSLVATALVARVMSRAARILADEQPALPTATIVSAP